MEFLIRRLRQVKRLRPPCSLSSNQLNAHFEHHVLTIRTIRVCKPVSWPPSKRWYDFKAQGKRMMSRVWFLVVAWSIVPAGSAIAQSDPSLPFPQNRVRDFYFRQAEQFLDQRPTSVVELLPQFPGLDGGGFGHWGQNPEEVSFDRSLNDADTGNVVCQLTHHFDVRTAKGVNVLVDADSGISVLFDPQRMTFIDAWQGGFVNWGFVRFGLMGGVEASGKRLGNLKDGAWQLPDGTPIRYRGYYLHGQHVAFETAIGNASVFESCSVSEGVLIRTLQIDGKLPASTFLKLQSHPADGVLATERVNQRPLAITSITRAGVERGSQMNRFTLMQFVDGANLTAIDGAVGILFDGSAVSGPVQLQFESVAEAEASQLKAVPVVEVPTVAALKTGTTGQWVTKKTQTTAVPGDESRPIAIDTITLPNGEANPFRSAMRIGGVGCLKDGRVVVSTLMGEVWIVDGIQNVGSSNELHWQRIAAGFYQALGVVIQHDKILVLGSDQITRLHDLNGDNEADFYECVTNDYPTTGGHDFCTSLQQDDTGRLYWSVSSGDLGVVRMDSSGAIESLGNGLRNSNGIGVSPNGRIVLASVQEGTWTPASAIFEIGGRSYHGLKGPKEKHGKYGYDLPLCFVPRGIDNSTGEIGYLPQDPRLGPLSGAAIGTSYGTCRAYLVLRDEVNGKSQGTIVPLPGEFLSGVCRVTFNQLDGCAYLAGTEGWQSYAQEDGCLQRMRLTGKLLILPTALEAYGNGIVVRFSETVDPASVTLENTFCQQWNYLFSEGYGSPEYSIQDPGHQAHDLVDVKSVRVLPDHKSVFLEIPQLHPVMQFHVHMRLKSAKGNAFTPDMYASIFELRSDFADYPEYAAVSKRRAPDFPIAEKYEQDPRLVQQERYGTDFGWVSGSLKLSVSALPGLQFEPRTLRVPPGARVSLAFHNGDPSMPHNVAVIRADRLDSFGEQSMQLASNPRAIATHYVPNDPAEICFSPILQPGDQYTTYFEAPKEAGEYKLVCTYPGHWRVMQGSLYVIPDGEPLPESAYAPIRKFTKMWTTKDLASEADTLAHRNFEQGRSVFTEAGCIKCHKLNDKGTTLGPDLTKVAERFKGQKLLQQILDPSTEINKQYQTWVAVLNDGRIISGLIVEQNDASITLLPNPLNPEQRLTFARRDLEELEPSLTSTMPMSLLITFTKDEILDVVAYIQSGGDGTNAVFAK